MSENLYDGRTAKEWGNELQPQKEWMRRHLYAAFALLDIPKSFLDVGCGYGWNVYEARHIGIRAWGVDQLINYDGMTAKIDDFFHHNLVEPFKLDTTAGMVWCTEVAEHLDPSAHSTLCDTLADNLAEGRGNYLIFSAAHPSQGGTGHLAERPAEYWKKELAMRDLNYRHDLTVNLALLWSNIGSPLFWLPANVMVFEK